VDNWEEVRRRAQTEGISPHLVLKEQIHLLVLDHLFRKGGFSDLVFQGGTAIRIAYHGSRFSEDLDFVLRKKTQTSFRRIAGLFETLPAALERYPLLGTGIRLKAQKSSPTFMRFVLNIPVEGTDIRDKTHLKVANIPSYSNQPLVIQTDALPVRPAVRVETPQEILADKLIAFGAREFVKGRDIWDIHFLMKTLNAALDPQVKRWVGRKVSDYRIGPAAFRKGFGRNLDILREQGPAILRTEMERFLPAPHRDLFREQFPGIARFVWKTLARFLAEAGEDAKA
jgi:predicted nucleotidyltransferase component of viral defense system